MRDPGNEVALYRDPFSIPFSQPQAVSYGTQCQFIVQLICPGLKPRPLQKYHFLKSTMFISLYGNQCHSFLYAFI